VYISAPSFPSLKAANSNFVVRWFSFPSNKVGTIIVISHSGIIVAGFFSSFSGMSNRKLAAYRGLAGLEATR